MSKKDETAPKKRVLEVPDKDILAEYEVRKKKDRNILIYLITKKGGLLSFFFLFKTFLWKKSNHVGDMYPVFEIDRAEKIHFRKLELYHRSLSKNPDVIQKKFKDASDEIEAQSSQPADKEDVRQLKSQISKKQEAPIQIMRQQLDKLTTELAVLRHSQQEFQQRISGWADSVNGQLRFTYAISKKADLFMKEQQSSDPFGVTGRSPGTKPRTEKQIGSNSDPFAVSDRRPDDG